MTSPEDPGKDLDLQKSKDLTPEQHRKVITASFLRPLNLMTLVAGLGVYFVTSLWWMLPLTLVVYGTVVYLASRDEVFKAGVLGNRKVLPTAAPPRRVAPERRAKWLKRGETRERVETALVTYRKVLLAIEESDDVTRRLLEDSSRKLDDVVEHMLDVAQNRERAETTLQDFRGDSRKASETPGSDIPATDSNLRYLESHIRKADEEISGISEQLLGLRAQVVRASLDSAGADHRARDINSSLDELNFRLEALNETLATPEDLRE